MTVTRTKPLDPLRAWRAILIALYPGHLLRSLNKCRGNTALYTLPSSSLLPYPLLFFPTRQDHLSQLISHQFTLLWFKYNSDFHFECRCIELLCKSSAYWRSIPDVKDSFSAATGESVSELSKSCVQLRSFGEVSTSTYTLTSTWLCSDLISLDVLQLSTLFYFHSISTTSLLSFLFNYIFSRDRRGEWASSVCASQQLKISNVVRVKCNRTFFEAIHDRIRFISYHWLGQFAFSIRVLPRMSL